jgi:hypothetical protein
LDLISDSLQKPIEGLSVLAGFKAKACWENLGDSTTRSSFNTEPALSEETTMSDELDAFLSKYSRESRENTLCLRKLILEVFPTADEKIDVKAGQIIYGLPRKTGKNWILAIALQMKYLNLIFSRGAQLPDPSKLLAGTGLQARHIKIKSEEETENPALQLLLKEAFKLNYGK